MYVCERKILLYIRDPLRFIFYILVFFFFIFFFYLFSYKIIVVEFMIIFLLNTFYLFFLFLKEEMLKDHRNACFVDQSSIIQTAFRKRTGHGRNPTKVVR